MANRNKRSGKLTLVENFVGMVFFNSPRITESDGAVRIENDTAPANAIAIFMGLVLLTSVSIAYFFFGGNEAAIVFVGGAMAGGMFVGLFYLIEARDRNRVLPRIERSRGLLVLESGTEIAKRNIECFRQYRCKTKTSNFRLVLTTVVTKGPGVACEYAVAPVIGDFSEDCVGIALANFMAVRLIQDGKRTFSGSRLAKLGLN